VAALRVVVTVHHRDQPEQLQQQQQCRQAGRGQYVERKRLAL
jgi:hypothetical protein